jgi:hypothetical protein
MSRHLQTELSKLGTSSQGLLRLALDLKDATARLELWGARRQAYEMEHVLEFSEDLRTAVAQYLQELSCTMVEGK